MAVQFEGILKELRNKVYHPVYFLHGDEPYYIDQVATWIESHVLDEAQKEFNQTILYGRDVDPATVFSTAKRYPMMSNYQVVIVREAQDIRNLLKVQEPDSGSDQPGTGNKKSSEDLDPFTAYMQHPQKSTLLVFCYKYKKFDKRTRISKLLEKSALVFESKKLYENQVPAWVVSYVKSKGYTIAERAAALVAEYLGTDLSRVSNELDKLMINLKPDAEITVSLIETGIGISKDFNVFELQNAMGLKDNLKVARIINYFGANPKSNPMVLILPALGNFFAKIITYHACKGKPSINLAAQLGVHPYFMKEYDVAARNYTLDSAVSAISLIHEYDMRTKGVHNFSASDNDLLKELVFRIMHGNFVAN